MLPASDDEVGRILDGAALWVRAAAPDVGDEPLVLVAGADHGDDGPGQCAMQAGELAGAALRGHRARSQRCTAGHHLLAFPAPAGSRDGVAVLQLPTDADWADTPTAARAVLGAARTLRSPSGLIAWQAAQRARATRGSRAATIAVTQLLETAEAFQQRYEAASKERSTATLSASRMDGLARETLRDAEAGRAQVAHELHDTAAQGMVSAHRFLEAAEGALGQDRPEQASVYMGAAHTGLMAAIRDVRRVLNTLVPPGLEELGVANALQIHVRDRVPPEIATSVTGSLPRAEGWLEARLFAMAAEAIGNAVAHGEPTSIRIVLSALRGRGIITIGDDGVGFDPAAARRQTEEGMGLIGMARQASWVGGQVDIASVPGEGTMVRITVPLVHPGDARDTDDAATGRDTR